MSPMPRSFPRALTRGSAGGPALSVARACLLLTLLVIPVVEFAATGGLLSIVWSLGVPIIGFVLLRVTHRGTPGPRVGVLTAMLTVLGVLVPGIALIAGAGFVPALWVAAVAARGRDPKLAACAVATMAYSVFLATWSIISVFHAYAYLASAMISLLIGAALFWSPTAVRRRGLPGDATQPGEA